MTSFGDGGVDGIAAYAPAHGFYGAPFTPTDVETLPNGAINLAGTESVDLDGTTTVEPLGLSLTTDGLAQARGSTLADVTPLAPTGAGAVTGTPRFLPVEGRPVGTHRGYTDTAGPGVVAVVGQSLSLVDPATDHGDIVTPQPIATVTAVSSAPVVVQVQYVDSVGVAEPVASDLSVVGPTAAPAVVVASLGIASGTAQSLVAEYAVAPQAGGWTAADDGAYTVTFARNLGLTATLVVAIPVTPTAVLTTPAATVAIGAASAAVTVTYTGATAINAGTIDAGDVTVTGPTGTPLAVTAAVLASADGTSLPVAYTLAIPGGFTAADVGAYTVSLVTDQVADAAGTANVQAGPLGTVQLTVRPPDTDPPTAVVDPPLPLLANYEEGGAVPVQVTFTDATAVRAASITAAAVTLTTPTGQTLAAQSLYAGPTADGPQLSASFNFLALGNASFTPDDNGVYTVNLVAGTVADTLGNVTAGGPIGTVNIAVAPLSATLVPAPDVTVAGTASVPVTLAYRGTAVRYVPPSAVGTRDLLASGPGGTLGPTAVTTAVGPGQSLDATYALSLDGAPLTAADDGTYILQTYDRPLDSDGTAVTPGELGTFTIAIPADAPAITGATATTATVTTPTSTCRSAGSCRSPPPWPPPTAPCRPAPSRSSTPAAFWPRSR